MCLLCQAGTDFMPIFQVVEQKGKDSSSRGGLAGLGRMNLCRSLSVFDVVHFTLLHCTLDDVRRIMCVIYKVPFISAS